MELKPDSGYDLIINNKKVDVKTTEYKTGKLLSKLNAPSRRSRYFYAAGR